ncbi:AmpG family muropeptide MFS transporter [Desulfobotulus mexicanus]|uniref:AmpG family muropeptide MFS transporter n=1 Tax=Desulfobotulus mexicanus TaxID=2586642 RepID=A0A5Q4VBI6_9BACT|nr:MFS transporter [Desulfobotulus mexicanus]TYT74915.1 AmpG family muropeptide MFS transporter [Desulfobotulus mexicanus]
MEEESRKNPSWAKAFSVYRHPRVLGMLFLGFSAGLPLLLVGGTFTAWLRDLGVSLAAIGFLSWVGMAHSLKILWAPVVDRMPLPFLTPLLGRRRSWMLLAQIFLLISLLGMAFTDPREHLAWVALWAVLAGFASATQDIAIDAYRIEAAKKEFQGAMAASYVLGYRVAILAAGAGALHLASGLSWSVAYGVMAFLMGVGIITTFIIQEPDVFVDEETRRLEREMAVLENGEKVSLFKELRLWFAGAIIGPFADFWQRFRFTGLVILLFIGLFRISDIFMGVMANPFYLDLGFTKAQIGNVAAAFGLAMTLTGAALGGVLVARFGIMRMLIATAVLAPLTNLTFSWLALLGPEIYGLVVAIMSDNISAGMAVAVFIAYLSSLTNTAYTATQYALFSSIMTLPGQFLAGFTGVMVEHISWFWFFISSAIIGLPAIFLAILLARLANPDRIKQPGHGSRS